LHDLSVLWWFSITRRSSSGRKRKHIYYKLVSLCYNIHQISYHFACYNTCLPGWLDSPLQNSLGYLNKWAVNATRTGIYCQRNGTKYSVNQLIFHVINFCSCFGHQNYLPYVFQILYKKHKNILAIKLRCILSTNVKLWMTYMYI
jgi:hypothetical protein